jgi:hypothetical protein
MAMLPFTMQASFLHFGFLTIYDAFAAKCFSLEERKTINQFLTLFKKGYKSKTLELKGFLLKR